MNSLWIAVEHNVGARGFELRVVECGSGQYTSVDQGKAFATSSHVRIEDQNELKTPDLARVTVGLHTRYFNCVTIHYSAHTEGHFRYKKREMKTTKKESKKQAG